ncbi:MAG TPA: hypothetical protein VEC99_08790, partial [Clostridia bacterium]|nr:hypothetical protein [Clostridia bacterium]
SVTSPLKCIDVMTGAQKWSVNGFGRGGVILVDNRLIALSERGDLVLIQPNPNAYTEVSRFTAFPGYDSYSSKCWNVPAVCDGRIYARSTASAVCLDVSVSTLKMLSPRLDVGNRLQLWVGTDTGAPIDADRLAKIEVRSATNLNANWLDWARFSNSFTLTNGLIRIDAVADQESVRFYTVSELP